MSPDVKVLRDTRALESLRGPWDRLAWHPRMTFDNFLASIRNRPDVLQPVVLHASGNSTSEAIIAGFLLSTIAEVRIGYRPIARIGVRSIGIPAGGVMGEITDALAAEALVQLERLRGELDADRFVFHDLPVGSVLHRATAASVPRVRRTWSPRRTEHWITDVPSDASLFHRTFEKRLKAKLSAVRHCGLGAVTVQTGTTLGDLDHLFAQIEYVASRSYQRSIRVGYTPTDAEFREHCREWATTGHLSDYVLSIDGEPCAFFIGASRKDVVYMCHTAYDARFSEVSPGFILLAHVMRDLRLNGRGMRAVDFGPGREGLKTRYGHQLDDVETCAVHGLGTHALCLNMVESFARSVSGRGEALLKIAGLAGSVRRALRGQTWWQSADAGSGRPAAAPPET